MSCRFQCVRSWPCLILVASVCTSSRLAADCTLTNLGITPLNDLGSGLYKGYSGGLYPNGANSRPPAHEAAGENIATNLIVPLGQKVEALPEARTFIDRLVFKQLQLLGLPPSKLADDKFTLDTEKATMSISPSQKGGTEIPSTVSTPSVKRSAACCRTAMAMPAGIAMTSAMGASPRISLVEERRDVMRSSGACRTEVQTTVRALRGPARISHRGRFP